MSNLNEQKVAIVTGSTGGIGEGIARRLANDGMAVVVSGRSQERGDKIAGDIRDQGGKAFFIKADMASEKDCINLIQDTKRKFNRIDSLINNAAIFVRTPIEEMTGKQWDREFAINVRGAFICSRETIPHLRTQRGGSIINMGTTSVYQGNAANLGRLAYAASKGALLTMTKTMARALLSDLIRVNWVTIGWVSTPGEVALRDSTHGDGKAYLEEEGRSAPLGRLETVEETAACVAYLVSDQASHVTGCELNISGGLWI